MTLKEHLVNACVGLFILFIATSIVMAAIFLLMLVPTLARIWIVGILSVLGIAWIIGTVVDMCE